MYYVYSFLHHVQRTQLNQKEWHVDTKRLVLLSFNYKDVTWILKECKEVPVEECHTEEHSECHTVDKKVCTDVPKVKEAKMDER